MTRTNIQHTRHSFTAMLGALGAEGMVDAVIQHLRKAENCMDVDGFPILDGVSYNVALQACVKAKQFAAAKDIIQKMISVGLKPDSHSYNIMINGCCGVERICDAFELLDRMHDEGLIPDLCTYNTLIKATCTAGELDAALTLLKEMQMKCIQPNRVTFNTLFSSAAYQGRLDVTEFLVEHMWERRIHPDLITCEHVVSSYLNCEQIDDAVESLRVLSIRMLSANGILQKQMDIVLEEVFTEDSSRVEESTLELLEDAVNLKDLVSQSLLTARLSGLGSAPADSWDAEKSPWTKRLHTQYKRNNMLANP
eukprot:c16731_g1_i2 orf=446-1372(-)